MINIKQRILSFQRERESESKVSVVIHKCTLMDCDFVTRNLKMSPQSNILYNPPPHLPVLFFSFYVHFDWVGLGLFLYTPFD
jgi:hypothetical protein